MSSQLDIAVVYASLYDPIVGASDGHGRPAKQTGEDQLHRTFGLKEAYTELRAELVEGIRSIEKEIINPALDARNSINPIRKTIKKRENKRLDVEKCQDRVHKLHRKMPRSPKEDAQLSKSEDELSTLQEVYLCPLGIIPNIKVLIHNARSSRLPMPICGRPYLRSSRLHSAWYRLFLPHMSVFRTSSLACTTRSCTDTVRVMDFSLLRLPWTRSLQTGPRISNLRSRRSR